MKKEIHDTINYTGWTGKCFKENIVVDNCVIMFSNRPKSQNCS